MALLLRMAWDGWNYLHEEMAGEWINRILDFKGLSAKNNGYMQRIVKNCARDSRKK